MKKVFDKVYVVERTKIVECRIKEVIQQDEKTFYGLISSDYDLSFPVRKADKVFDTPQQALEYIIKKVHQDNKKILGEHSNEN